MVKTAKIALAGLIALAAAAALFAAAGAASDSGAQQSSAVAQQPATAQNNPQPTGADWSCSTATRAHRFISGFQRSLINHFQYEITEQVVCVNETTQETWNGPQTRRRYWVCTRESDDAVVECPAS